MNLKIIKQNKDEAWAICPFHSHNGQAEKNPSLLLSFTGNYAGYYKCFGCGAYGKLKDLGINMKVTRTPKKREKKDWYQIWQKYAYETQRKQIELFANELDIAFPILTNYYYIWMNDIKAHGFPIMNEQYNTIGLQKRYGNGRKVNVKGSLLGLFISLSMKGLCKSHPVFITEGLTDCLVTADLGPFEAVGRLNAKAVTKRCIMFCINWIDRGRTIRIISDNDKVGIEGSRELQQGLILNGFKNVVVKVPEAKDLRELRDIKGKEYTKKWLLEN